MNILHIPTGEIAPCPEYNLSDINNLILAELCYYIRCPKVKDCFTCPWYPRKSKNIYEYVIIP